MPMLYLVIAIYGWIAQWIDRILLLRLLLPPPPTHEQLMVYIVRVILPLAVVGEPPPPPPRSRPPRGDARLPESRPLRLRPHLLPRSLRRRDARPQLLRGPGPGGESRRDTARFGEIRRDSARLRETPRDSARFGETPRDDRRHARPQALARSAPRRAREGAWRLLAACFSFRTRPRTRRWLARATSSTAAPASRRATTARGRLRASSSSSPPAAPRWSCSTTSTPRGARRAN